MDLPVQAASATDVRLNDRLLKNDGGTAIKEVYLAFEFHLLFVSIWRIPFCEPCLALPVLNENK